MTPDDWHLKLGEYISFARQAARIVRERRIEFTAAVREVLSARVVADRERTMLAQKVQSIVYLGLEDE